MTTTITIKGTAKDIAKLEAMLAIINLEIVSTTETAESPKETPKAKAKTSSKKKSDDDFDRKTYEELAKSFGCYGKNGCWKACRPIVYAVMNGEMTKANGKREVAKIAKAKGWALTK